MCVALPERVGIVDFGCFVRYFLPLSLSFFFLSFVFFLLMTSGICPLFWLAPSILFSHSFSASRSLAVLCGLRPAAALQKSVGGERKSLALSLSLFLYALSSISSTMVNVVLEKLSVPMYVRATPFRPPMAANAPCCVLCVCCPFCIFSFVPGVELRQLHHLLLWPSLFFFLSFSANERR